MQKLDNWDDKQKKILMLNMFPLVAFSQIKEAPKYMIVIQALGNIIIQLENQTVIQAISQGIYMTQLNSEQKKISYLKSNIIINNNQDIKSLQSKQIIINDNEIGLSNPVSFQNWILASQEYYNNNKVIKERGLQLKRHFRISDMELVNTFLEIQKDSKLIEETIKQAYCQGQFQQSQECSDKYLGAYQWCQSGITLNSPIGPKYPSIVFLNSSAQGYPELHYFFYHKFLNELPEQQYIRYKDIQFYIPWAINLLKHNNDINNWIKDQDALLHVGNLKYIFEIGEKFRIQNDQTDLNVFKEMQIRFNCSSVEMARVLFEYLDYIATDFATLSSQNGTKELLGIAALSTQGFYKYYSFLKDNLSNNLTNAYLLYNLKSRKFDILTFIQSFNVDFANDFSDFAFNLTTVQLFKDLCLEGMYSQRFNDFAKKYEIKDNLIQMCSFQIDSFKYLEQLSDSSINLNYNCNPNKTYCTDKEIAILELIDNQITNNINQDIKKFFEFNNLYKYLGVEIMTFTKKYGKANDINQQNLIQWSKDYLNFENLFCVLEVQKIYVLDVQNKQVEIEQKYKLDQINMDSKWLLDYMRYLAMQLGLGGFVKELSVHDLLYGYVIDLFQQMKTLDPAVGGNPFQPNGTELGIAQNFSYEQSLSLSFSMKTGIDDYKLERYYTSQQNSEYINYMDIVFDGNKSQTVYPIGWAKPLKLKGTDGFINRPNNLKDNVKELEIFVAPLWRNAIVINSNKKIDHFGIESYRYNLDRRTTQNKQKNPSNADYFQDKLDGFLNCSQMMKGPMFQSKMNFLHVDPIYQQKVKMFNDIDKKIMIESDQENDESYLDVEPYTGMSVGAWLKLQFNMYFYQSQLLLQKSHSNNDIVIPIIGFVRGADIPQSFADGMMADLKIAIQIKTIITYLFLSVGLTGALIICILLYKQTNKNKQNMMHNLHHLFKAKYIKTCDQ